MTTLYHEVWIDASPATVFGAIATAEGVSTWWAKQTAVQTEHGLVLEHDPGPEHGIVQMKVLDASPDSRVEWECVSTHPAHSPASAWTGTHVVFEITRRRVPPWASEPSDMTVLRLLHTGWQENNEYLGFCNFAWAQVLQKLKETCEQAMKG